jgi:hypothetical protein
MTGDAPKPAKFPAWIRPCLRVIRMVSELQRMGFQRLRIFPYEYPLAWRLCVAPRAACHIRNGAYVSSVAFDAFSGHSEPSLHARLATYSAASERDYFGWTDARTDSARDLADKFIHRFPAAAAIGRGRDWEYAGWLDELIGELEKGPCLPFVTAEYFEPCPLQLRALPIRIFHPRGDSEISLDFPLPPGGDFVGGD